MTVSAAGSPSLAKATPPNRGGRDFASVASRHRWALIMAAAAFLVFAIYYWTSLPSTTFVQRWLPITSINEALIWVIMAVGLNIVVGYAGLLDLGYVAFWAIGGYTAGWIMSSFLGDYWHINFSFLGGAKGPGIHITFWGVLIVGGLFCALWGIIIGAPTLRLKSDYLALVTLGFGEIIPQIFHNGDNIAGRNFTNGTRGIEPIDPINFPGTGAKLGTFDDLYRYVIFVGLAALIIFISLRLREGRLGRAWLAIREDELAASMMGVPLMRTKLAAYAVGAFAGGIGGVAYSTHISGVNPDRFAFSISITVLAMVVLGGMGNVWGVTLGALILAWINSTGLKEFGNTFNSTFGTNVNFPSENFLLFGLILVLMMLFRREGLLPEARTRLVLREAERTDLESVGADMEEAVEV